LRVFIQSVLLHAGNIYQVFSAAILSLNPGAFNDVQRQSGAGLVLSNGYFEKLDDTTILLEMKLSKDEMASLLISGSNAFYPRPIPVTRIQKILVNNDRVKKDIITNALSGDGGIIPDQLISSAFPSGLNKFTLNTDQVYLSEFNEQLYRFDKILGTFSFLRNYAILLSNRTQSIETFPDHFFAALQAINQNPILSSKHEKQTQFYRQLFNVSKSIEHPLMAWLITRVDNGRNFTDEDTKIFGTLLFSNSNNMKFNEESRGILELLAKNIDRRNILIDIAQMNEPDRFYLYLFAALRLYGNVNTESRSISRIDLKEIVSPSYGGFVFALLGYFFGYEKIRNFEERVNIKDEILLKVMHAPRRWAMKFELNTLLDYVIIDSVYELVFHNNKNYAEIGDSLFPNFLSPESIINLEKIMGYEINQTVLLGKRIVSAKQKLPNRTDVFLEMLANVPNNISAFTTLGNYCVRKGLNGHLSSKQTSHLAPSFAFDIYLKKEEIILFFKDRKEEHAELIERVNISLKLNDFL
jgi:hypothetical protein